MEALSRKQSSPSLSRTVGKIVDDTHLLVRQEIELVKTEFKQSVKAVFALVIGAALATFGVVLFTIGIVALLWDAGTPIGISCLAFTIVYFGGAVTAYLWFERKTQEIGWPLGEPSIREGGNSPEEDNEKENVRWLKNQR